MLISNRCYSVLIPDGSVINAQIHTLLEDILWVATLPQLRSAITFYSYIMSLVRQTQKVYTPVCFNNLAWKKLALVYFRC